MGRGQRASRQAAYEGAQGGTGLPGWVPEATRTYLAHVEGKHTIRELAKAADLHPSTILRRVRRVEMSRDDPLVDAALTRMVNEEGPSRGGSSSGLTEKELTAQALPILRRLCEPDAVLAVSQDFERAVVARRRPDGEPQRLCILDRALAVDMALRDWISCGHSEARVQRYRISLHGRMLLRRADEPRGFADEPIPFIGRDEEATQRRAGQMESPLAILSRRRSGTGEPFLSRELVAVADRFREDLLVAQKEEASPPDWAGFLARLPGAPPPAAPPRRRSGAARARPRIERALIDLGPGLADVAVWTCGFHEGLEQVEKRLNWSARSGKVVLRIALERLQQHYRSVEVREGLVRP